jgi:uncharacterized protein (TIGR02118 family)
MTKVSVLYPNAADARFDMAYYCNSHMPMVRDKLSAACRRIEVDEGVGGGQPGVAAPFLAVAHMYFDSLNAFQGAFGPHAESIMSDIPNYTNVQPTVQISEVRQIRE